MSEYVFTSESVSEGHPDKICDQISDTIVDMFLTRNPEARVAVETLATTNQVVLAGEVRGDVSHEEMEAAARETIRRIGYEQEGFHWQNAKVDCYVHGQSADIAQGVDEGDGLYKEEGAGDQGIMFGFACTETPTLMPAPIFYCHEILRKLAGMRHDGERMLEPDAKSQVTLRYVDGKPVGTTNVVVSHQHAADATQGQLRDLIRGVINDVLPNGWMPEEDNLYVNPTGQFIIGGPDGDAGLTGRKIIVDTYGGAAPHGGGAFSGKDPTKVDRSAAYASRYVAKNVVAAGLAEKCVIQLSYTIGVAKPMSIFVDTSGTGSVDDARLAQVIDKVFDLTPKGIRQTLGLNKPIYQRTASYGHFGREPDADGGFSWEKTDLVEAIKSELT